MRSDRTHDSGYRGPLLLNPETSCLMEIANFKSFYGTSNGIILASTMILEYMDIFLACGLLDTKLSQTPSPRFSSALLTESL